MVSTDNLSRAFLRTEQSGDIASGRVALAYEGDSKETVINVEYDTVHSPSGLTLLVTAEVGDMVSVEESRQEVRLTEEMREHAVKTLSHYHNEAVEGNGATSNGGLVFTGIPGSDDGWTPE